MDYTKFTSEFKDEILKDLCQLPTYTPVDFNWSKPHNDIDLLTTCLHQFQEMGLILRFSINSSNKSVSASVTVTAKAIDLLNRGGFTFLHDRYLKDLEKANLELEKLQASSTSKSHIEQISNISSIISNLISTVVTLKF